MKLTRLLAALLIVLTGTLLTVIAVFSVRPDISALPSPSAALAEPQPDSLRIQWLGTSSLLISDGQTHVLTDAYFSRIDKLASVTRPMAPDVARIDAALKASNIEKVAVIPVLHSHFDHVLDSPWVAMRTGADLAGSESTLNVGRGAGMGEPQLKLATPGEPMRYGDFEVIFLLSDHVPQAEWINRLTGMNETIDAPLTPPAPIDAWKEAESYALLVRHPYGDVLIQGSAGFVDGQLDGYQADIAFVSSVGLSRQPDGYVPDYVRNTVGATGAKTVVPIHWDDFFVELDADTPALPRVMEDLYASFDLLDVELEKLGTSLTYMRPMETIYFRASPEQIAP